MVKNYTPIDYLVKKYQQKGQPVSRSKETEPVLAPPKEIEIRETIEKEVGDEELKDHIKVRKETIKLPPDLKKIGLRPADTVKFPDYRKVKIPISDEKVIEGLKAPATSSFRWLATLAEYILKQAHITLKRVHGRIVRVVKT